MSCVGDTRGVEFAAPPPKPSPYPKPDLEAWQMKCIRAPRCATRKDARGFDIRLTPTPKNLISNLKKKEQGTARHEDDMDNH